MYDEMNDRAEEVFLPGIEPLPRPAVGLVGQVLAGLAMLDGSPVPMGAEALVLLDGRNGYTCFILDVEGWIPTGGGYGFTAEEAQAWERGEAR